MTKKKDKPGGSPENKGASDESPEGQKTTSTSGLVYRPFPRPEGEISSGDEDIDDEPDLGEIEELRKAREQRPKDKSLLFSATDIKMLGARDGGKPTTPLERIKERKSPKGPQVPDRE